MIDLRFGDCLELMRDLPDASVDLILCDLPYGTTQCQWDAVIPWGALWLEYKRITKERGAIVLTAAQPFSSAAVMSNPNWFRYSWVWNKSHASNPLNAKKRPMARHEDILVFSPRGMPRYNPQMRKVEPFKTRRGQKLESNKNISDHYGVRATQESISSDEKYPTTDLYFSSGARFKSKHPTQKPVALMEYLIRTYTNEGDMVLDNCMGSGTTGVACVNTGRNFIGMEKEAKYFAIAYERIHDA